MRWIAFWVRDLWLYCRDVRSWVIERVVVRGLFSLRQENAPQQGLYRLLLRLGLKRYH